MSAQGDLNRAIGDLDAPGLKTINGNNPTFADNPLNDAKYDVDGIIARVLDTTSSATPSIRFVVVN